MFDSVSNKSHVTPVVPVPSDVVVPVKSKEQCTTSYVVDSGEMPTNKLSKQEISTAIVARIGAMLLLNTMIVIIVINLHSNISNEGITTEVLYINLNATSNTDTIA